MNAPIGLAFDPLDAADDEPRPDERAAAAPAVWPAFDTRDLPLLGVEVVRTVARLRRKLPTPVGMVALCDHPHYAWALRHNLAFGPWRSAAAWALASVNAMVPADVAPPSTGPAFVADALAEIAGLYLARGVTTTRGAYRIAGSGTVYAPRRSGAR